jgi:hypothetical protein
MGAALHCCMSSLKLVLRECGHVTHIDSVTIELLSHKVSKVDPHSLTKQERAVICNVHTCTPATATMVRQQLCIAIT